MDVTLVFLKWFSACPGRQHTPVILAHRRWGQKDREFKPSLSYIRPSPKKKKKKKVKSKVLGLLFLFVCFGFLIKRRKRRNGLSVGCSRVPCMHPLAPLSTLAESICIGIRSCGAAALVCPHLCSYHHDDSFPRCGCISKSVHAPMYNLIIKYKESHFLSELLWDPQKC